MMQMRMLFFAVIIGAIGMIVDHPRANPTPAGLVLRSHVSVEGVVVTVGDLFDNAGEAADGVVAYAPPPGRRAVFDADWLARAAQRLRLPWQPASRLDRVVVERLSTVVNAGDIEAALGHEFALRGGDEESVLNLANRTMTIHLPVDQPPTIEVSDLVLDPRGDRFSATIAVPAGHPKAQHYQQTGFVTHMAMVPVLTRDVRRGDVIDDADVTLVEMPVSGLGQDAVTDAEALVGMEARRGLRGGQPMRQGDLRAPVLVAKGDAVTMVYATSLMRLTTVGRALENGSRDDVIRVLNTDSNQSVEARVDGPQRVSVIAVHNLAGAQPGL